MKDCTVFFPPRAGISASWLLLGRTSLPTPVEEALGEAGDLLGISLDTPSQAMRACLADGVTGHVVEMAICVGMYRSLRAFGLRPTLVTGHSMGLYSALAATGCVPLRQGLEYFARDLERLRNVAGGLAAVIRIPLESLEEECDKHDDVWVSGINARLLNGVSGTPAGLARLELWTQAQRGRFLRFSGYGPWHCPLVKKVESEARRSAEEIVKTDPEVPIIFPLASPRTVTDRAGMVRAMVDQMLGPVCWRSTCKLLLPRVSCVAIEVGPEATLSKLLQESPRERRLLVHWHDLARGGRARGAA